MTKEEALELRPGDAVVCETTGGTYYTEGNVLQVETVYAHGVAYPMGAAAVYVRPHERDAYTKDECWPCKYVTRILPPHTTTMGDI